MALVRFGGGVTEMRGSIAGTTFSRARGGAIARNRTVPINPNTLKQADVRTQFAIVVAAWNDFAEKNSVDGWNSWASNVELVNRLGEAYTPSGRQMFLSVNLANLAASLPVITDAPVQTNAPDPDAGITQITAEVSVGSEETLSDFSTNTLTAQVGTNVFFDATPPLNPGVTNVENLYRRIATFTPTAAAKNLTTDYIAVYPEVNPAAGSLEGKIIRWRYRLTKTSNPILSAYNYGTATIVAA